MTVLCAWGRLVFSLPTGLTLVFAKCSPLEGGHAGDSRKWASSRIAFEKRFESPLKDVNHTRSFFPHVVVSSSLRPCLCRTLCDQVVHARCVGAKESRTTYLRGFHRSGSVIGAVSWKPMLNVACTEYSARAAHDSYRQCHLVPMK